MKIAPDNVKEDKLEVVEEQQQKKEIRFIGSQWRIPGLSLWEFNTRTKILDSAKFKKQDVSLKSLAPDKSSTMKRHKVDTQEHCIYFQALNRKSAEKKLFKILESL